MNANARHALYLPEFPCIPLHPDVSVRHRPHRPHTLILSKVLITLHKIWCFSILLLNNIELWIYFLDIYMVIAYRSANGEYLAWMPTLCSAKPHQGAIDQSNGGAGTMHITDMVMHVDNYLGEHTRRNIEKAITDTKGVVHAHFNERRPHLMLVSYDTERTSSFEVLARMTKQQVRAERIG